MPQLDLLIFKSQSIFVLFFLLGYFIFLKNILSILAFELKYKVKLEIYYLRFFSKVIAKLANSSNLILNLLISSIQVITFVQQITNPYSLYFGFYSSDFLVLKMKYNRE